MTQRILVVSETFWPEDFLINDLVREWQANGHTVDILTQWPSYPIGKVYDGYENKDYATEQWGSSTIHRFRLVEGYRESKVRKLLNYLEFVRRGTKIGKRIGGAYNQIFVAQTGPLTQALVAVAIKRKFGIPMTIWTFDIWPDAVYAYGFPRWRSLGWFVERIIRKVYGNSDQILVSSRAFADTINRYVPKKEVVYAPNWLVGQCKSVAKSDLRLEPDKFHFTFTGNISISQNMPIVVRGFAYANLGENVALNIVGDGSSFDELRQIIDSEGIKNVRLHGRYPYEQMSDILSQSNVLLLPLVADEGIEKTEPLKLQTYLASGKPILGICRGSVRDIIVGEGVGLCAEPNSVEDIADKFKISTQISYNELQAISQRTSSLLNSRFNKNHIINTINQRIGLK